MSNPPITSNEQVLLRELTRIVEVARNRNYSNEFIGNLVRSLPEFSIQDIYDLRKANGLNPYDGTAVETTTKLIGWANRTDVENIRGGTFYANFFMVSKHGPGDQFNVPIHEGPRAMEESAAAEFVRQAIKEKLARDAVKTSSPLTADPARIDAERFPEVDDTPEHLRAQGYRSGKSP